MIQNTVYSETAKHRARLTPYCQGYGIDIGFGGDPITSLAVRVDLPVPYAHLGDGVQLGGDCRNLYWFADGVLDFVYSSHVLEDFDVSQTIPILKEWSRVLKDGGKLILLQPDQQRYLAYCTKNQQPPNPHHSIGHFSLQYVIEAAKKAGGLEVVASEDNIDEYSFFVVFSKSSPLKDASERQADLEDELKWLKLELARVDAQCKLAESRLERYHKNPFVRAVRTPLLFARRWMEKRDSSR